MEFFDQAGDSQISLAIIAFWACVSLSVFIVSSWTQGCKKSVFAFLVWHLGILQPVVKTALLCYFFVVVVVDIDSLA